MYEITINGHEIVSNIDIGALDTIIADDVIIAIKDELSSERTEGCITLEDSRNLIWRSKFFLDDYLDAKIELLRINGEVIFEYDSMIYIVSEDEDKGYNVKKYSVDKGTFTLEDCEHYTGSKREVIYYLVS